MFRKLIIEILDICIADESENTSNEWSFVYSNDQSTQSTDEVYINILRNIAEQYNHSEVFAESMVLNILDLQVEQTNDTMFPPKDRV